jgi:hypothetical protein
MTSAEMVTDFKLMDAKNKMVSIAALMKALNEFCGKMAEEYNFCDNSRWAIGISPLVPEKYSNLIAYAVEGKNEGYYVHVGAIVPQSGNGPWHYIDFGFAKTWSPESAYALAKEASRFLAAAQWN